MDRLYQNFAGIITIVAAILVFGIISLNSLPLALYPQVVKPVIRAGLSISAMSTEEFRTLYGERIENTLMSIPLVEVVDGDYSNDMVTFTVEFDWSIGSDEAKTKVQTALSSIESELPREWGGFWVYFRNNESTNVYVALTSEVYSPAELSALSDQNIVPTLESMPFVDSVFVSDLERKMIEIILDPMALLQYRISPQQVQNALLKRGMDKTIGSLAFGGSQIFQVVDSKEYRSVEDVAATEILRINEKVITLSDLASVRLKTQDPSMIYRADGKKALIIGVTPKPEANLRDFSNSSVSAIRAAALRLDPKAKVDIILNPAVFIEESVENVIHSILLAILITVTVVLVFLRSWRSTILVSLTIPISMIADFVIMDFIGLELNLISMGGFALAVGMVVDAGIVVVENINRQFDQQKPETFKESLSILLNAVAEVRLSVVASTLTTIIVFAPLTFTAPMTSAILGDLAIVVVCIMAISALVTLIVIPSFYLLIARLHSGSAHRSEKSDRLRNEPSLGFNRLRRFYLHSLDRVIASPMKSTILGVVATGLMIGSIVLGGYSIKHEIMAPPATDKVILSITDQTKTLDIFEAEALLETHERKVLTLLGDKIDHLLSMGYDKSSSASVFMFLKDKSQLSSVKKILEEEFKNSAQHIYSHFDWTPSSLVIPTAPLISATVLGENDASKRALLQTISESLQSTENLGRVRIDPGSSQDEFLIWKPNPVVGSHQPQGSYGSLNDLALDFTAMYSGRKMIQEIILFGDPVKIFMSFPEKSIVDQTSLENILIASANTVIPLRGIGSFHQDQRWSRHLTTNGKPLHRVQIWPSEGQTQSNAKARESLQDTIMKHPKIQASQIVFEDPDKDIRDNINSLLLAMFLSMVFITILLTLQFGSFIQTAVIMLAIPLGITGSLISLWVFNSSIGINSMLGMILLCGTAVNNSILIVEFYKRMRNDPSMAPKEMILNVSFLRFRPIFITSLTTILGMLPIAVGWGSGGEILQPLGIAICGGLGISTLLTLYVVPLALFHFERLRLKYPSLLDSTATSPPVVQTLFLVLMISLGIGQSTPAQSATLLEAKDLIDRALKYDPSVAEQDHLVRIAELERSKIITSFLPHLSLHYETTQRDGYWQADNAEIGQGKDFSRFSTLEISQTIANPVKQFTVWQRLGKDEWLAESNLKVQHWDVRKNIVELLIKLETTLARLTLQQTLASLSLQNKNMAKQRFDSGLISKVDYLRVSLQFDDFQQQIESLKRQIELTIGALKRSTGDSMNCPCITQGNLVEPNKAKEMASDISALIPTLSLPDIQRAEWELAASRLFLKESTLDYLPSLKFGARYSRNYPTQDGFVDSKPTYFVALEWDLFSGGLHFAERQIRKNQENIANEKLRAAKIQGEEKEQSGAINLHDLADHLYRQSQTVSHLEEISTESQKAFNRGLLNTRDLNADISAYVSGKNSLIDLQESFSQAFLQLAIQYQNHKIMDKLMGR